MGGTIDASYSPHPMRPAILFPLFGEIRSLSGIGPKLEKLIAKVAGGRILDLVLDLPVGRIDRSYRPKLADAEAGRIATVVVNILSHKPPRDRRQPYRIQASDETSLLELVFFRAQEDYLKRILPEGSRRLISGRIERYSGKLQMPHPEHVLEPDQASQLPDHEPVYALTEGLSSRVMTKAVAAALEKLPQMPEWLDPSVVKARGWDTFSSSLRAAHAPEHDGMLEPTHPIRQRLAYDELLANQLALLMVRSRMRGGRGQALMGTGLLRDKAMKALPFTLTQGQMKVLSEIDADLEKPTRMLRLLQGDVGSGKTVVAFLALLRAVESGSQGALMAPTDLLCRQHMQSLEPLARATGVRLAILTGRERAAARDATLEALANGEIDILIGTHALFSDDVAFKDLALAVVDEQHRFGVHQRMKLQGKGGIPANILAMTATPIPRTLALTAYGDMDVSRIEGRPVGRKPITTRALPATRLEEVVDHIRKAIANGAQGYWVCPLVEESEKIDLAAAEDRAAHLTMVLGSDHVGLVHGKMKAPERDAVMGKFRAGEISILVATTVIEVGVDVPNATIMVVEHAERFGLAQLHQLRGRIGRGSGASTCLLMYQAPLGETAKARLKIMRETDDGFVIAEEDLRLRGAGEVLGTRQSGEETFRLANLSAHSELLAMANDDARLILSRDPELKSDRGQALRALLYLFERDEAVRYLRTG